MLDKNIINLVPKAKKYVLGTVVYQVVLLSINVLILFYFSKGIRLYMSNSISLNNFLYYILIAVLATVITRGFFSYRASKASFKASKEVKYVLRKRIISKIFEKKGDLGTKKESELVQLSVEGVEQVEAYMSKYVPQFFYSLLAPIILFVVLVTIDVKSALVLLLSVPLIPILIILVRKKSTKVFKKFWNKYTDVGDSFLESLYGLTILKTNKADADMQVTIKDKAEKFRIATMNVLSVQLHSITIMDLVAYGASAIGMLMAILSFKNGQIDLASTIFIILVAIEFFLPLRLLGSFFHLASSGMTAASKIFEYLNSDVNTDDNLDIVDENLSYEIENLSYSYGDKKVLNNININMPRKGLVSIVGTSGCGKTTLAKILSRNLKSENIKLFGQKLEYLNRDILYSKVCYVPSNPKIFGTTVKEAVLDNPKALELVNLNLDYNLELKDNCSNISGGQKQRLALGRSLANDFDIYLLDEATSNVDKETEDYILDNIKKMSKDKLIILISHRMRLSEYADMVYVLDKGNLDSFGSFKYVYENSEVFKTLYNKQSELEND